MKAISLVPHTTMVSLTNISEPQLTSSYDVKIKVLQVGICGTDKEEVAGGRADALKGKMQMVIGHEMFGQVVETGNMVQTIKKEDYGLFIVRRGCNECAACLNNRSDMCYSGKYTERGIKGADGYQAEYVVDNEKYFIKVPESSKNVGVLTEPMSVAAKAIDEAVIIQKARFSGIITDPNWLKGKKTLVAGLGTVGLMAASILRLNGAEVAGLDIVDENSLRVQILKNMQGSYIDGREVQTTRIDERFGEYDLVFEAVGLSMLQIQLIDTLAANGIYVTTGISSGSGELTIKIGDIFQQLVLKNQVMLGSVNASMKHYKMAVDYLEESQTYWPGLIEKIITHKIPYVKYHEALFSIDKNEIKMVLEWNY